MKIFIHLFIAIAILYISCNNQDTKKSIEINYKAQTRGFNYEIYLKKDTLKINSDNILKKIKLTKVQYSQIINLANKIDFKEIKNNISVNELAVDSAIKGVLEIKLNSQVYEFEFNHHNLPKSIQQLFTALVEIIE